MDETIEKKIENCHQSEEISDKILGGTKKEKMEKIVEIIKNYELSIENLASETRIPLPTMYKYIKELKKDNLIYEDDRILFVREKAKEDFNDNKFLEFILPEILYTVKIKRLATIPPKNESDENLLDNREIQKNRSIKTVVVEFTQRGYEQKIAELLYDKYLKEISLITVGVGGLIIYMSKNNVKSKALSFLKEALESRNTP